MRLYFVSSNYLFVHVQISFKQKKKKEIFKLLKYLLSKSM